MQRPCWPQRGERGSGRVNKKGMGFDSKHDEYHLILRFLTRNSGKYSFFQKILYIYKVIAKERCL
jgi:hypothetical protein